MQRLQYIVSAVCALGLMTAHASTSEPWEIVPEDSLRELRGGIDLGNLVGSFAIQRVVQIDGVIVARMQIVISNLDRLGSGGMPTVSVTGPLAQLVQFMNTGGSAGTAAANGSLAQPGSAGASNAPAAANGAPAAAASSTAGIVPTIALRGEPGIGWCGRGDSRRTGYSGGAIGERRAGRHEQNGSRRHDRSGDRAQRLAERRRHHHCGPEQRACGKHSDANHDLRGNQQHADAERGQSRQLDPPADGRTVVQCARRRRSPSGIVPPRIGREAEWSPRGRESLESHQDRWSYSG